jgi:CIC family chloride channel protein
MLAVGIAYVALRRHSLYPAQLPSRRAAVRERHAAAGGTAPAGTAHVAPELPPASDRVGLSELAEVARRSGRQRVVVVSGPEGPRGLVELQLVLQVPPSELGWLHVTDAMVPFVSVAPGATVAEVAEVLERCGISQVPVVEDGAVVGFIGDRELRAALLEQVRAGEA